MLLKKTSQRSSLAVVAVIAGGATGLSLLAGCGGHHNVAAPPTRATTTTIPTTTTTAPPPVAPLTGLPVSNPAQAHAPAVVVKIDNVDQARPQTGVGAADLVYEEEVEGGLTRLAAVFQSDYPTLLGPVRSGRLTDEGIADDLNHPVFAYAGTNAIFLPQLRAQPLTDVDINNHPEQFFRAGSAPAPHNLYTNVASLAKLSTTGSAPAPLFQYRTANTPLSGSGAVPASHISIGFPAAAVTWDFNPQAGAWLRGQNGTPHVDAAHQQLSATNVVVLFINYVVSGMATGEGVAPAPIPEGVMTGSGQAWFLSGDQILKGNWNRTSLTSPATYTDSSGAPVLLAPGKTWVELVPTGVVPAVH